MKKNNTHSKTNKEGKAKFLPVKQLKMFEQPSHCQISSSSSFGPYTIAVDPPPHLS